VGCFISTTKAPVNEEIWRPLIPWLLGQGVSPDQRDSVGGAILMYAAPGLPYFLELRRRAQ
jgi:hypothetical protein